MTLKGSQGDSMYLSSQKKALADPTIKIIVIPSDQYVNIIVCSVIRKKVQFLRESNTKQLDRTNLEMPGSSVD